MHVDKTGTVRGIPYDWQRPTWARVKGRVWNPDDSRVLVPKVFDRGWTVNVHALLRRPRVLLQRP